MSFISASAAAARARAVANSPSAARALPSATSRAFCAWSVRACVNRSPLQIYTLSSQSIGPPLQVYPLSSQSIGLPVQVYTCAVCASRLCLSAAELDSASAAAAAAAVAFAPMASARTAAASAAAARSCAASRASRLSTWRRATAPLVGPGIFPERNPRKRFPTLCGPRGTFRLPGRGDQSSERKEYVPGGGDQSAERTEYIPGGGTNRLRGKSIYLVLEALGGVAPLPPGRGCQCRHLRLEVRQRLPRRRRLLRRRHRRPLRRRRLRPRHRRLLLRLNGALRDQSAERNEGDRSAERKEYIPERRAPPPVPPVPSLVGCGAPAPAQRPRAPAPDSPPPDPAKGGIMRGRGEFMRGGCIHTWAGCIHLSQLGARPLQKVLVCARREPRGPSLPQLAIRLNLPVKGGGRRGLIGQV
eukprot:1187031-Prorocentrum_minimum.AAC.1